MATNLSAVAAILWLALAVAGSSPAFHMPWGRLTERETAIPGIGSPYSDPAFDQSAGLPIVTGAKTSRIIGGQEATPHEFPWQVALILENSRFCGGSLISPLWVLTAATCLEGLDRVEVLAGAHNYMTFEETQVRRTSRQIILHEDYDPFYFSLDNIALVELMAAMPLNDAIGFIALPSRDAEELQGEEMATVTGWGPTEEGGVLSPMLRYGNVTVMDHYYCAISYGPTIVNENVFCVDPIWNGQSFCGGDIGGPLTHLEDGHTALRGIMSFIAPNGCGSGGPDGLTEVGKYLEWIAGHTGLEV